MNAPAHPTRAQQLAAKRLRQIAAMQAIEGNPLTAEDIAMFEMFDREGWSSARQHEFIIARTLGNSSEIA
jgi:hypothetical protein